jgi:hypothetical protein
MMSKDPGYPDDIRMWDWHPNSPFYQEDNEQDEDAEASRGDDEYQRMKDKQLDDEWESKHT